jgi:type I restriction enzyme M protein
MTTVTDLGIPIAEDGYIEDFISGVRVKAGPEEVEATQVFSRRLVQDLGYSKDQIQTRPQFRVKENPSGREKWPVDICVYRNAEDRTYENVYMVVECKRPTRKDGERQLRLYLQNSFASLGVWFNGRDHLYLRKVVLPTREIKYQEIYSIPRADQSIADIGQIRRRDLAPPTNLKATFKTLRNRLAGMARGTTQDIDFAKQTTYLLFCKIWDEQDKAPDEQMDFHAGIDEDPAVVAARVSKIFETKVKGDRFATVFDEDDRISLDPVSVEYIVGELQNYAITEAPRDAVGDAFEVFIGETLKGPDGQFFTPRNVVRMMVDILDPQPGKMIIDPACGSGGFLIVALEHVWRKVELDGQRKGWSAERIGSEKARVAERYFRGCDKDSFLTKVTKAYMAIVGDGQGGIVCENSLLPYDQMHQDARAVLRPRTFDYLFTNPPFGSKIKVQGDDLLRRYALGHKWIKDKAAGVWRPDPGEVVPSRPPQILFIERCLDLLDDGGRMAIVLPESTFGNPSHRYILEFLRSRARFLGLVSMPEDLFQPYTHAKACVVFLEKLREGEVPGDDIMFMGIVKWCGHDSRGNTIPHDDVPEITTHYWRLMENPNAPVERFGFLKRVGEIRDDIFIPKYYDPEIEADLAALDKTHELRSIGQLIEEGVLAKPVTGDEVGKLAYGTGEIPFVRTSDLSNWELKIDPKQGISEEIAAPIVAKQRLRSEDILMVRDGTYLVGTTAMLTEDDTNIVIQSHLLRLRSLKAEALSPYLLLAMLNTSIVKRQIRAKQFTQDIIDTLGGRVSELVLPIPRDPSVRADIMKRTRAVVESRAALRREARSIIHDAIGDVAIATDEKEALADVL